MLPKVSKPQGNKLYKVSDYANVAAHYAATGGLVIAGVATSVALGQPMLAVYALGFTGFATVAGVKFGKMMIEKGVIPYAKDDPDAIGLAAIAEELYLKSGLKAENNPIYDFKSAQADAREKAGEEQKRKAKMGGMGGMGMIPNAAALNFDKPIIMITRPLLKLLNTEEEKAVLAHEFAHAAARHTHTGLVQGVGATFAVMTAGFSGFMVALSGGFLPYLASVGAELGVRAAMAFVGRGDMKQHLRNWKTSFTFSRRQIIGEERELKEALRKLNKERNEIKEDLHFVERLIERGLSAKDEETRQANEKVRKANIDDALKTLDALAENSLARGKLQEKLDALRDKAWAEWSEKNGYKKFPAPNLEQIARRKSFGIIGAVGATAAGAALLTAVVGPVYLGYLAASLGIGLGGALLNKHFQQSNELQADKKVIELGADPLALMTALRKLELVHEQSLAAAYDGETLPKKGVLTRIWTDLNASHPATKVRVRKLAALARKNGLADADIKAAAEGPLSVGAEHNIPPALIRMQLAR
jgi:Zn-dependent protease with chaperone function